MKNNTEKIIKKLKSIGIIRLATILGILVLSLLLIIHLPTRPALYPITIIDNPSPDSIIVQKKNLIIPVLYTHPPDLSDLTVKERKHKFIQMMLPSVFLAREKLAHQLREVKSLLLRRAGNHFSDEDSLRLDHYFQVFKAKNPQDLLPRMQPPPPSIILAQAAIESGWGTSRFFNEANNIYGVWSYNSQEQRIKANNTRNGKSIYLRKYNSLFDSVYDYLLTIARSHAYKDFRKTRQKSKDPYRLIWYLSNYSEQRIGYVYQLRLMLEHNNLIQYDHYQLMKIDKEDEIWKKLIDS